jgi:Flp pilus assembly protein TadD
MSVTFPISARRRAHNPVAGAALPAIFPTLLAAMLTLAPVCHGQTPAPAKSAPPAGNAAPTEPFEISEAERKAYAQTMKDARALLAQKKYDDAIAKLDQLAKERPREPQARFLKGVVLTDQDKLDAAVSVYRGLTADFPEMPEPHNNLAVLYSRKGELGLARDELLLAVQTAPDYAVARENLGDVYARLAAEQYEKAATLDKRNKSAPAKLKLVRDVTAVAP